MRRPKEEIAWLKKRDEDGWKLSSAYQDAVRPVLTYISDLEAEMDAVMHFVDKWLDGDELNESPANRANTAREKALKAIETASKTRQLMRKS